MRQENMMRVGLRLFTFTLLSIALTGTVVRAEDAAQPPGAPNGGQRPVKVIVYPLLVQTPLFGAEINLPSIPGAPGGGGGESGEVSGSTDVSLNTAYLAGVLVQTNRLFVEASGTWADISAERELPHVLVKTNTLAFLARGGVRLFDGISATAGVHHLSTDLDVTLNLPSIGHSLEGSTKPGYWDPMLGVDWRHSVGRWEFQANFEGGGFGVGTDVDLSSEARVDYRIGFFDVRFGFAITHIEATILDVSIGQFQRTMVSKQTLYGPNIGFGIAFGK